METNKRRQIPTTNVCKNFSFRGLRIKKNSVTLLLSTSVTVKLPRSLSELQTSQQRHPHTIQIVRAHTRDLTMVAAGWAFGPDRAAPDIILSRPMISWHGVWCVSLSVWHAAVLYKTAKRIEVLFEMETLGDHCFRWGSRLPAARMEKWEKFCPLWSIVTLLAFDAALNYCDSG